MLSDVVKRHVGCVCDKKHHSNTPTISCDDCRLEAAAVPRASIMSPPPFGKNQDLIDLRVLVLPDVVKCGFVCCVFPSCMLEHVCFFVCAPQAFLKQ